MKNILLINFCTSTYFVLFIFNAKDFVIRFDNCICHMQVQVQKGSATGKSLIVQDISAPASVVLEKLLDFENYGQMSMPWVSEASVKNVGKNSDGSRQSLTRTVLGMGPFQFNTMIRHSYHPKLKSITFTLDDGYISVIDSYDGYWHVLDQGKMKSRVYHSTSFNVSDRWIPSFFTDILNKRISHNMLTWIKEVSEAATSTKESRTGHKKGFGRIFGRRTPNELTKANLESKNSTTRTEEPQEKIDDVPLIRYFLVAIIAMLLIANVTTCLFG
mmetsp:Transcript_5169/g.10458  ORF Transcript_5169/g.10458 Transcript_5169/m.10458 type:complete len:273 (-) Transcript_5169:1777-2595(-)